MDKLNNWLQKNIFLIALIIGVSGIFFRLAIISRLDLGESMRWIHLIFDYSYISLEFFRVDSFRFEYYIGDSSYLLINYLDFVFYILLVISAIVYRLSQYKEVKVLKFCFSLIFLFTILSFLFQAYLLLVDFESRGYVSILFLLKTAFITYICYFYLITWKSQRTYIDTEIMSLPNFQKFTLKRAEWYQRLVHYLLDLFLILCIFSKYVYEFYFGTLLEDLSDAVGERFAASIVFVAFGSIYYLIFEGFFKSTPAKYLTQTSIVNLNNDKVSFSNILGRTLCRRIPFDAFSFFGKIGWHDSLAYSTVAKQTKESSKYKIIYIIFIILLIALVLYRVLEENRFI